MGGAATGGATTTTGRAGFEAFFAGSDFFALEAFFGFGACFALVAFFAFAAFFGNFAILAFAFGAFAAFFAGLAAGFAFGAFGFCFAFAFGFFVLRINLDHRRTPTGGRREPDAVADDRTGHLYHTWLSRQGVCGIRPAMRRALSTGLGSINTGGDLEIARVLGEALRAGAKDDGRRDVHGFHSYSARLAPTLVARLLGPVKADAVVLDPFAGSGTTLIEANRRGLAARGVDANPLAVRLATLKTTYREPAECKALVEAATAVSDAAFTRARARARTLSKGDRFDDPSFYEPHVFRELVGLREEIARLGPSPLQEALLLVFSAIVVKFSKQAEGSKPTRPHDDDDGNGDRGDDDAPPQTRQIGRGIPSRFFHRKAEELSRALAAFNRTRKSRDVEIRLGDARRLSHLGNGSIGCVITSPPYLGTYDYVDHHRRRYGWLGIDPADFERQEIGARRRPSEKDWSDAVTAYLKELARVTRPGAPILLVTGDSTVAGKHVPGDQTIRVVAPTLGLRLVAWATEERQQFEPTSKRKTRLEHVLLLTHS